MKKYFLTQSLALTLFCFGVNAASWHSPETENPLIAMKSVSLGKIPSTQTLVYEMTDKYAKGDKTSLQDTLGQENLYTSEIIRISATEQTAGVGQHGRTWQSPPGNVYVTYLFPWPEDKMPLGFFVPQVTTVSMAQTAQSFDLGDAKVELKWINDFLLNGKKSGGVLCKSQGVMPFFEGDAVSERRHNALVVGIGINVNMDADVAQERFDYLEDSMKIPFTSLRIETGREFSVEEVLSRLTQNLVRNYRKLLNEEKSFEETFSPFLNMVLAYRGKPVVYMDTGESTQTNYTLVEIDGKGQAVLEDEEGNRVTKLSGRVRLRD